jgi:hypothetical protein
MSAINWDDLFYVNLTTGAVSDENPQDGSVAVPTFGNYGGPFNPPAEELLTKPNGDPYSYNKLVKLGAAPEGMSDYFYYGHDVELAKAGSGYTTEHAQADINLIQSLTLNDTSYSNDAEATLYDGFVTLAMIGRLLINDQLDQISPTLLQAAATDAVNDIEYGLQNLPTEEQTLALQTIFGLPDNDGIFQFAFTFPTIPGASEFQQEVVEWSAINAVAAAINENTLQGDIVPLPTWEGDDYILQFHQPNSDLDILLA